MTDLDVSLDHRSAREVLDWSRAGLDPALRSAVDRLPDSMRAVAGYHFGWWDEDGRPTGADAGKAIRPALVLLGAQAVGGAADAVEDPRDRLERQQGADRDDDEEGQLLDRESERQLPTGDVAGEKSVPATGRHRDPRRTLGCRTLSGTVDLAQPSGAGHYPGPRR